MSTFNADAIPDLDQVRETLVERMERYRYAILGGLAIVVFGSLGLLAWTSLRQERLDSLYAELHLALTAEPARPRTSLAMSPEDARESLVALESLRERAKGTKVEPLVLFYMAQRRMLAEDDAGALAAAGELRSSFPDDPITSLRVSDSEKVSVLGRIEEFCKSRMEFAAVHKVEPPVADKTYTALVETDLGTMKFAFYRDAAPGHVEAFLDSARKGRFNGTGFYNLHAGEWIEGGGGDHTRNTDPKDDAEDDPNLAIRPEDARYDVKHVRGVVTSVPLLSGDQADRFAIVLQQNMETFDGQRTPFGELLDDASRDIADRLATQQTYSQDPVYQGHRNATAFPNTPSRPVRIRRISVWKEGVLDAGHTWDTARVGTDQPEPSGE